MFDRVLNTPLGTVYFHKNVTEPLKGDHHESSTLSITHSTASQSVLPYYGYLKPSQTSAMELFGKTINGH